MDYRLKVQSWKPSEAKEILKGRLDVARKHRENNFEAVWKANESMLFQPHGDPSLSPTPSYNSLAEVYQMVNTRSNRVHIPKVMQNLRFLHSQMSANPPSVLPTPTSNDLNDRRATEAADDLIRYGREEYNLQEWLDLTNLSTLSYGTGVLKAFHDPHAGEVLKFDESSGFIEMTGDFKCRPILVWDFWMDPDARVWSDVRYVFERHLLPVEQALSMWPEQQDLLMNSIVDADKHPTESVQSSRVMSNDDLKNSVISVFEYTEKALPVNGMAGRHCFMTQDGTVLGEMHKNPHPGAALPYGLLTDIDVPGEVYGKTTVEYALGLARAVDALDNMILKNIKLHGSIKMVVFDQSETNEENYSSDPVDIITVNGTHAHAPYQLKPASVTGDVYNLRAQLMAGIDGVMGINELLQGQVNRELSGFASQTAINAANIVRHRVFNKYTALVKRVYELFLDNVRENWKIKRKIKVLGVEDSATIKYIEGADVASGYTIRVEYGANFSLDPAMRREEIMQAKETLVEAGVNPKKIAQMLRYNEIDNLFDSVDIAKKRQLEIFETAIAKYEKTGRVEVEKASLMRKAYHLEMAEAAMEFVMTRDFLTLDSELKEAIYAHIDEREQLAAEQAAPSAPAAPAAPGGLPGMPGLPPMPGGPAPVEMPIPDIGGVL